MKASSQPASNRHNCIIYNVIPSLGEWLGRRTRTAEQIVWSTAEERITRIARI